MSRIIIMTSEDIRRTLNRIAHEIIERNKAVEHLILVGMHTRGVPLANRLAANIRDSEELGLPVCALDISLYRDDLSSLNLKPVVQRTDIPASINGRAVVFVDDVLYTGRRTTAARCAAGAVDRMVTGGEDRVGGGGGAGQAKHQQREEP